MPAQQPLRGFFTQWFCEAVSATPVSPSKVLGIDLGNAHLGASILYSILHSVQEAEYIIIVCNLFQS